MNKWLVAALLTVGLPLWGGTVIAASNLPNVGEVAPAFKLADQAGKLRSSDDFRGKWLVLYFYPRDDTPGCTEQACTFRDDMHKLTALGAEVVGISVDDSMSHAAFARKYSLPFPLLADDTGSVASSYGSMRSLAIVKFAQRNTFLIDPNGRIAKVYLSVSTSKNSQEIIDDLKLLTVMPKVTK